MAFILTQIPGLADVPAASLAAGQVVNDALLAKILGNAKFQAVRLEVFYAEYRHGQTVELPVSDADSYSYARSELVYSWELVSTLNENHLASAAGELFMLSPGVDPETGEVSVITDYYVQSAQQTNTNDGLLGVTTWATRGLGDLTVAVPPVYTDLADSAFNQDGALKQTIFQALLGNSKLARFEIFSKSAMLDSEGRLQGYANGDTVPVPISAFDGYAYVRGELTYLPFWIYTGKADRSGPTGCDSSQPGKKPGRIRYLGASVNPATGVVSTEVNYWNGMHEEPTHDGIVGVLVMGERTLASFAAKADTFTDVDVAQFFAGETLGDAHLKYLNQDAKFGILRREAFADAYTNGNVVPLPTSLVDGYKYSRSELSYPCFLQASTITGAQGAIQLMVHSVNPSTGAVSLRLDYNANGQARNPTHEGQLWVIALGRRSHENVDTVSVVTPGSIPGQTIPAANLVPNGNFEAWIDPDAGVADAWDIYACTGTGSALNRQAGISGLWSQGLYLGPVGPYGSVQVISSPFAAIAGDRYMATCLTKALGQTFSTGFRWRLFLYDSTLGSSVSFALVSGGLVDATINRYAANFVMPAKNDTEVETSLGTKSIDGTLDFDPAYVRVCLGIGDCGYAGVLIAVDDVIVRDVEELAGNVGSLGPSASLVSRVKAGTPSDSDFDNPVDGLMVVDSSGTKIWVRVGGAWKYASLT